MSQGEAHARRIELCIDIPCYGNGRYGSRQLYYVTVSARLVARKSFKYEHKYSNPRLNLSPIISA